MRDRRRAGGAVTLGVAASAIVGAGPIGAAGTGCVGNDCAGDTQDWGSCDQGERVDDYTWESGPVDGTYLDFHGGRTWLLDPSGVMGQRAPVGFEAFVSLDATPYASGGSGFAQSAGNIAEFHPAGSAWQVNVLNDTCAQYYLRVVLTYPQTGSVKGACKGAADAAVE